MTKQQVLLIEDDMWLADSYKEVLEGEGFECTAVTTVDEALDIINTTVPDVIVADVLLGDHTVIGLLHELQSYEDTGLVPVIICSTLAKSAAHLQEQLHEYGVVEILDKATVTPESLAMTVQEYA